MQFALPAICALLAFLILTLAGAISLKVLVWTTNAFFGALTAAPGIGKAAGIFILSNVAVAAVYFATVAIVRKCLPASASSWDNAIDAGFWIYFPLSYIALTCILWKTVPTSFPRAVLIAAVQGIVMGALTAALYFLLVLIAFATWPH